MGRKQPPVYWTDEYLQNALLCWNNLSTLEKLIEREKRRLARIDGAIATMNPGGVPPARKLPTLLQEIKGQVDSFLGSTYSYHCPLYYEGFSLQRTDLGAKLATIAGAGTIGMVNFPEGINVKMIGMYLLFCGIVFGSEYHIQRQADKMMRQSGLKPPYYIKDTIVLAREPRADLLPSIAHEYTHHVQGQQATNLINCGIFKEGHARGVERFISERYARLEKNPAFLRVIVAETVEELEEAYQWICTTLGAEPRLELPSEDKPGEKLRNHTLGNTIFYLQENCLGKQIYRDVLQGRNVFAF